MIHSIHDIRVAIFFNQTLVRFFAEATRVPVY